MNKFPIIHFRKGDHAACGIRLTDKLTFTTGAGLVTCKPCQGTVAFKREVINRGRVYDCPCERKGKGCTSYTMIEQPPYYICKFTKQDALVPRDGGGVGDVCIAGLMFD
jgi:hypothetical protein